MRKSKQRERFLSASDAKSLDKKAVERFGIPVLVLMENAGRCVGEEALNILRKRRGRVAIFCGTGNNGGDGFCAARHLLAAGIKPDIYLSAKIADVKNEAKTNLDILLRMKQKIIEVNPVRLSLIKTKKYSLIIDALLGVGLKGEMRYIYQELIRIINASRAFILSVDIPSGLDATTGKAGRDCVKADRTITFVAKKRGMVSETGKEYCGEVLLRGIGIAL
ncbi:MAG: NAD(P)H-hydrate epimerase [Candidatus Omnitrophica bacterium]|jgi:NAD(P)H-hydrate epimerase|nr:NAD(P)H-hydrate epimerase [Candidatus Omnitrophota bacterium]